MRLMSSMLLAAFGVVPVSGRHALAQDEMFELVRKIQVDEAGPGPGQNDSCEFSKDGKLILGADNRATAKLYDRATGKFLGQVKHRILNNTTFLTEGKMNAAGFSFDGTQFYTGINAMGLKVWDLKTLQLAHHFADGRNTDSADFSPNDRWLAVGAGNEVWIYERPAYRRIHSYSHVLGEANHLDFSFDNQLLVSSAGSGTVGEVIVTRTSDWQQLRKISVNGSVKRVVFSPDANYYGIGAKNQICRVYRTSDGQMVAQFPHKGNLRPLPGDDPSDEVQTVAESRIETVHWSRDGGYFFSGSIKDGLVRVYRVRDWSFVGYAQGQERNRQVEYLDVSSDNELLACGDEGAVYHFKFRPAPLRRAIRSAGPIVIETDDFDTNLPMGGTAWRSGDDATASGGRRVQALPDSGRAKTRDYHIGDPFSDTPKLDYRIAFTEAGTWYVWLRGRGPASGNLVHVGLNDKPLVSADNLAFGGTAWTWQNARGGGGRATITVAAAGEHTLNVWMGSDGVELDKILLTQDPSYSPTGLGPEASRREGSAEPAPVTDAGSGNTPDAAQAGPFDAGSADAAAGERRDKGAGAGATGPARENVDAAPTRPTPRPSPSADPRPEDPGGEKRASRASGCAVGSPSGGPGWLVLVAAVVWRRRRRSGQSKGNARGRAGLRKGAGGCEKPCPCSPEWTARASPRPRSGPRRRRCHRHRSRTDP